jgi:hypothetical protein
MFRVLATLAVSMTAVSMFLTWLEPTVGLGSRPISATQCIAGVKEAVGMRYSAITGWRGVTIVPMARSTDTKTLAAVGLPDDVHFEVAPTGDVVAHGSWKRQIRLEGADDIRIGVNDSLAGEPLAQMQLVALSTLLNELRPAFSVGGQPARIRIAHGERAAERSLAQAVRALLNVDQGKRQPGSQTARGTR